MLFIILAVVAFVAGLGHARLSANVLRHFAEVIMALALFYVVVNVIRTEGELTWMVRVIILAGFRGHDDPHPVGAGTFQIPHRRGRHPICGG